MDRESEQRHAPDPDVVRDTLEERDREIQPDLPEEQPPRVDAGRPQDERDIRAKSAGKGKKTADKWNQ